MVGSVFRGENFVEIGIGLINLCRIRDGYY